MLISLKTRLTISVTLVSMLSVLIISIIVNFFLEKQFREYAIRKQEERNLEIVSLVSKQYLGDNNWHNSVIENIGISILEESLILQVMDNQGRIIWDALEYNSGICHVMMEQMSQRMLMKYPSLNGGLSHKEYDITVNKTVVGKVKIGYYGPFFYTDSEFFFIDTINKVLLAVAAFSLILSLVSGFILSNTISAPIIAVTKLAGSIAQGDYHSIDHVKANTSEVRKLIGAINHMSATLSQQEQIRKRLTADVAHELRTPLTTLRAGIEAMIDGVREVSPANLESYLEEILRIINLVHDMETLSRFDAETIRLNKTDFSVLQLAQKLVAHHLQLYAGKNITVQCTGDDFMIHADKEKTNQVLLNLFANACKFTNAGGTISLSTHLGRDCTQFVIKDNGVGIPAANLPYVFERFYRVDESRTRATGGSGIGLTIVQEIVKAHNWQITINSTPGIGTEITLTIS